MIISSVFFATLNKRRGVQRLFIALGRHPRPWYLNPDPRNLFTWKDHDVSTIIASRREALNPKLNPKPLKFISLDNALLISLDNALLRILAVQHQLGVTVVYTAKKAQNNASRCISEVTTCHVHFISRLAIVVRGL